MESDSIEKDFITTPTLTKAFLYAEVSESTYEVKIVLIDFIRIEIVPVNKNSL